MKRMTIKARFDKMVEIYRDMEMLEKMSEGVLYRQEPAQGRCRHERYNI